MRLNVKKSNNLRPLYFPSLVIYVSFPQTTLPIYKNTGKLNILTPSIPVISADIQPGINEL